MAAAYFRALCNKTGRQDITVSSAGVFALDGGNVSSQSAAVMEELGINMSSFQSSMLTRDLLEESDLIITMTSTHRAHVMRILPEAAGKTRMLLEFSSLSGGDVDDPFGGDIEDYRSCFKQMKEALDNLFLDLDKLKLNNP